jgi:hypothetical protein
MEVETVNKVSPIASRNSKSNMSNKNGARPGLPRWKTTKYMLDANESKNKKNVTRVASRGLISNDDNVQLSA